MGKTVRTFTRNFTDRKTGSFSKPAKKSKTAKSTQSNDDIDNEIPKPRIIHSKASTKSMQSSVKTKIINGKTETVQKKVISHNTQIKSGDSDVKMTFSQQSEKRSETDHADPS